MLLAGRVLGAAGTAEPGWVGVEDGRVAEIGSGAPGDATRRYGAPVGGDGYLVAPGFVDLQVNGYAGHDAAGGLEAIAEIARLLPATGVTAFLPTVISGPLDAMLSVCAAGELRVEGGARVLGAHLEGPFLNPAKKGAHDPEYMALPTPSAVEELAARRPRLVTIAPELPGALDAIGGLAGAGAVVSVGHSLATYEEARQGFAAGARFVTHLFNAMSPLGHREPGVPGAVFSGGDAAAGLIADGVHVHPAVLDTAVRLLPPGRLALTTDMVAAAGAPPGRYRLGTLDVVSDGRRVTLPNGTLAGASATMDELVRVVAGLPSGGVARALEMATATPAAVLGEERLGRIAAGLPADLVLLDETLTVRRTLIAGEEVFRG